LECSSQPNSSNQRIIWRDVSRSGRWSLTNSGRGVVCVSVLLALEISWTAGRPRVSPELRELIRLNGHGQPIGGGPAILKLGFEIAESTVSKYVIRHRGPPSPTWRTFQRNHSDTIAGLAEFERELIRARTGEGRKRAKARGVRKTLQRLAAGETHADIARTFGVDATTIGRLQPDSGRPFGLAGASVAA
jgi:hypothetical protein